jgi:hypothetical protein
VPLYHPQEGTDETDTAARRIPACARCARPARSKPRLARRPGLAAARLALAWPISRCDHLTIRLLSSRLATEPGNPSNRALGLWSPASGQSGLATHGASEGRCRPVRDDRLTSNPREAVAMTEERGRAGPPPPAGGRFRCCLPGGRRDDGGPRRPGHQRELAGGASGAVRGGDQRHRRLERALRRRPCAPPR